MRRSKSGRCRRPAPGARCAPAVVGGGVLVGGVYESLIGLSGSGGE